GLRCFPPGFFVLKEFFSALTVSIFGLPCAAYQQCTPPRKPSISLPGRKTPSFRIEKRAGFRPLSPNRRFRGCMSGRHDISCRCFIDSGSQDLLLDFLYLEHPFHLLSPQNQADANGARTSRSASVPAASAHTIANCSRSLFAPYFG